MASKQTYLCDFCGKSYQRHTWRHENNKKRGRKNYCSLECKYNAQMNPITAFTRLSDMALGRCDKTQRGNPRKTPIPHDIDGEHLYQVFLSQGERCPITGWRLTYYRRRRDRGRGSQPDRVSLDRKVPELGYTKGNVQIVARQVNSARGPWSENHLKKCAGAIMKKMFKDLYDDPRDAEKALIEWFRGVDDIPPGMLDPE